MNYKLDIFKLLCPLQDEYLKYLSKHNYMTFNISECNYKTMDCCSLFMMLSTKDKRTKNRDISKYL